MQQADTTHDHPAADPPAPRTHPRGLRRLIAALIFLLVVLLMAFIPPLLNISRFQRRIERNISDALGRPVQFSRVSLTLLPLPGFTLENFAVAEDPAFGAEPVIAAGSVEATVRFRSLWHGRVEFSKISLSAGDTGAAPSVNLVHTADGRWNIQGLLLQASRIQAAPTAQPYAGPAPRFPYIEATGARLNLKLDRNGIQEKTPFSLTDADFALWLPEPHQWHLRLRAHPVRTDAPPADAGTLRIDGTLGAANSPAGPASLAQLPIDLSGEWQEVQLGGLSHLLLGRDAGLRGELTLSGGILGTLGQNTIAAHIQLSNARRAAFVPPNSLNLEATCHALAQRSFHAFSEVACRWPPADSSDPALLAVSADLPDIRNLRSGHAAFSLPAVPTATLLDWISLVTARPPTGILPLGTLTGSLAYHAPLPLSPARPRARQKPQPPQPAWTGQFTLSGAALKISALGARPIQLDDLTLRAAPSQPLTPHSPQTLKANPQPAPPSSFDLLPIALPLGGRQQAVLEGHFDANGYTLHLTGAALPARLLDLGDAIPQLGDGLQQLLAPPPADADTGTAANPDAGPPQSPDPAAEAAPIHLDLTATRPWGGSQTWVAAAPPSIHRHRR
ncbi:MAG: AsmA family protein [Acidobacteriaceae bacterium]|jgi:AsmA protein